MSHNDGKKIYITLRCKDHVNTITNRKLSASGYGVFEDPLNIEFNQISKCMENSYWQYDFPKYVTLSTINKDLIFSEEGTRAITLSILRQKSSRKLLIKLCQDDHILVKVE
ncbi:hypothetical protein [Patiriisocius sp. Uisw_047]|uniref:hypothetical protein n=1 Tax=Patiriisocius sp. Uisw_047 TaxID=3230969 RepID=UPI0039EC6EEE